MNETPILFKKKNKNTDKKIKVAFVNPPNVDWSLANNAAYLMFQSHYFRFGKYNENVEWIPAPYRFDKYESCQEIYEEIKDADIFLFSSYVWNYTIVDELAELVRLKKPNSIMVIGGPHIGKNDKSLFEKRRNLYDFICQVTKPGEIFVQDLIDSFFENEGKPKIDDISWELRSDKKCDQFMPDYSVYEEHLDYLKETRQYAKDNNLEPFVVLETTRGCPYSCTFCEWGGGIGGKIYKKPMDVVKKDILALKEAGFIRMYSTDANFGVFMDRDVEIFKFAWDNKIKLSDTSTFKHKSLKKRIELVDKWFEVIKNKEETIKEAKSSNYYCSENSKESIGIVPTVSIQSVSEEAMKVAKRVDLTFDDKIKLSEHIYKKCREEGFIPPSLELILGMPGSTIDDFYEEFNILYNFGTWGSHRHDYMFLPDSEISEPDYIKKYNIQLVDVYSDLLDETGEENIKSLYKNKKSFFRTISSCYSFTYDQMCEMYFMAIAGNFILRDFYDLIKGDDNNQKPSEFVRDSFQTLKKMEGFDKIYEEIKDILNPKTPPKNFRKLFGEFRDNIIEKFIQDNKLYIISELSNKIYSK